MDWNTDISTIQDFQSCCRLCFERGPQLENLFASSSEPDLAGKIVDCLGVSILREDFPATSICVRCLTLVDQFYDFKQLCKTHDHTFHTSIRARSSEESFQQRPSEIQVKTEVLDDLGESIQQAPLDITNESIKQEMALAEETREADLTLVDVPTSVDERFQIQPVDQSSRNVSVRLIYNGYLMKCNGIKLKGVMQWICRNSACKMSFSCTVDWRITLHMNNTHNHYPYIERGGMIRCVNSGFMKRYAVSTITGKNVLIWNGHEWVIGEQNKAGKRRAKCKEHKGKCRKYLTITGDFNSLEEFGEHNHQKNFILFRDEENPSEDDLNPWNLFSQINPCRLPIGNDWDMNRRVKLFCNRYQYRLLDCAWNGTSRWACDTVNCPIMATMDDLGKVHSTDHKHEPIASGLFNGLYYCVVRANLKCLKLFFNGHCYGSRDSDHWVCTTTACYVKLYVGSNYESFAEKGQHTHEGYNAVVKPINKEAIHLTTQNPFLPPSITINDLQENIPSTSATITDLTPSKVVPEKPPKDMAKKTTLTDEPETMAGFIRMFFDGFRYTLWEIFPDGTTYWRCWGMRCRKSLHMSPAGSIYFKNECLEHQHGPQVSRVDQVTHGNGQTERYAIFTDTSFTTILVYRNKLWNLVLGEASYIATCRELRCEAKIKITDNFSHFEHIEECGNHGDKLLLIRTAAQQVEGDLNIWELFKQKYPLQLIDGTTYSGGRHSQLFFGGFRYTMQALNWNGSSLWRCALQKCSAKGRIVESIGTFPIPSHNHEKQVLMQGRIWSQTRQQEEHYFVIITLKKTTATLYYNTYCYALKDKQRNVWTCFHSLCNASLRIDGDFELVVDEMEHNHDGTLTFIRGEESADYQECYGPAPGSSRKRPREDADVSNVDIKPLKLPCITAASTSTTNLSPKLEAILNTLVKLVPKSDQNPQQQSTFHYHGGYTYSRSTVQADGNIKLECNKPRCPGRVILAPDQTVLSKDNHTHSKTFDTVGGIKDSNDQYYLYILVSGTQKRNVTYFVCDGFRYHVQSKAPDVEAEVIWQCVRCDVKVTVTDSYSHIGQSSLHSHEPCDIIIPSDELFDEPNLESSNNTFQLDEVLWGQHRYNTPIYIRRLKQTKWKCYRQKECKAYLYQNQDGCFKEMETHDHEGPIELCGEAAFDRTLKLKDRFAIMKNYGKSKYRHLVFQNQVYVEGNSYRWDCVRKSCNAKLNVDRSCDLFQQVGEHSHQPIMMAIKFQEEVLIRAAPFVN